MCTLKLKQLDMFSAFSIRFFLQTALPTYSTNPISQNPLVNTVWLTYAEIARGSPACALTHPLTCRAQQWSDSFPQMDDCAWAMITSVLLYSEPWNASVSSQAKKTQETSYAVLISSTLLIIHSANMLYQQVCNFGVVSELCCCYQSLHAGIPPLSLLLFSHTFFSSPSPLVSLPSPLRLLSVSVVMCWILSKQILLLWPEPGKIFPEGLT